MLTNVKGKTGLIAERAEPAASLSRDWSRPWLADGGHRTFRDPDFLDGNGSKIRAMSDPYADIKAKIWVHVRSKPRPEMAGRC